MKIDSDHNPTSNEQRIIDVRLQALRQEIHQFWTNRTVGKTTSDHFFYTVTPITTSESSNVEQSNNMLRRAMSEYVQTFKEEHLSEYPNMNIQLFDNPHSGSPGVWISMRGEQPSTSLIPKPITDLGYRF